MSKLSDLSVLKRISSIPTAPFFEERIIDEIKKILMQKFKDSVNIKRDRFGNLIAHYKGSKNNLRSIAYIVHTDHPGFNIDKNTANVLGYLNEDLIIGSDVCLHTLKGTSTRTKILGFIAKEGYIVKGKDNAKFAIFDLPLLNIKNGIIRAPVLDDYAGIAMCIAALSEIVDKKLDRDIYIIFHRAEEIGFIGAYGASTSKILPKDTIVYSVETSSEIGSVKVGSGIVLRTGDLITQRYNSDAIALMRNASKGLQVQEARMSADICESSLYYAMGYRTAGICVPLMFWHNNGADKIVLEEISLNDMNLGTQLLIKIAETPYKVLSKNNITLKQKNMVKAIRKMFKAYHDKKMI